MMGTVNGFKAIRSANMLFIHEAPMSALVEGVILAGGRSSRMGFDKASLKYGESRLIDHSQNILAQTGCDPICISGSEGIPDRVPGSGPVGGLCTMIVTHPDAGGWLFIPVDMPLLSPDLLKSMISNSGKINAVCFEGTSLPLLLPNTPGVRRLAELTLDQLTLGVDTSVRSFLKSLPVTLLPIKADQHKQFANLNTPREWKEFLELKK